MNVPRPLTPCIYVVSFISFPVSQFRLTQSASVAHPHRFPPPTIYSSISPILISSSLPPRLHLICFEPCIVIPFPMVHVLEHIVNSAYSFHPVLMCTVSFMESSGHHHHHHNTLLQFLRSQCSAGILYVVLTNSFTICEFRNHSNSSSKKLFHWLYSDGRDICNSREAQHKPYVSTRLESSLLTLHIETSKSTSSA